MVIGLIYFHVIICDQGAGIPNLLSVTDLRTGITVGNDNNPGGVSIGLIVGLAILGVVVIALIVIVIILLVRKKASFSRNSSYQPLAQASYTSSFFEPEPVITPVNDSGMVTLLLEHDVLDKGDSILDVKRGDICVATIEDWKGAEAWLWVRIGTKEGYGELKLKNFCCCITIFSSQFPEQCVQEETKLNLIFFTLLRKEQVRFLELAALPSFSAFPLPSFHGSPPPRSALISPASPSDSRCL